MRVNDRNLTGAGAAETAHAQEVQKTDGARTGAAKRTGSGESGDRVELSAGLGQLARAISTHGGERATRVEELAAVYRSGGYQADSAGTARAMVSEALSPGLD